MDIGCVARKALTMDTMNLGKGFGSVRIFLQSCDLPLERPNACPIFQGIRQGMVDAPLLETPGFSIQINQLRDSA